MKRTLIIPATIALLTGMAATAQETNSEDVDVNASEAVIYTSGDSQLEELSIAELNALQLEELEEVNAETDDLIFQAESEQDGKVYAETGRETSTMSQQTRTDRIDPDSEIESYAWEETVNPQTGYEDTVGSEAGATYAETEDDAAAMGGPEYASETDAMADFTAKGTILDMTATDERFSTLATLVRKASLAGTLETGGPYTVFAPTDAAFEKYDPDFAKRIEADDTDQKELDAILKAHLVDREIMSDEIAEGDTAIETLAGTDLYVEKDSNSVTVNNAHVVSADIGASNGVIHAIDTVIAPVDQTPAVVEAEADTSTMMTTEQEVVDPGQDTTDQ